MDGGISAEPVATACVALTWYRDADGDGVGTSASTTRACEQPLGYTDIAGDCNDNDPNVRAAGTYYPDTDGDSYGAGTAQTNCGGPGWSSNNLDCNDANVAVYPGATKTCGSNVCTNNSVPACSDGQEQTCLPKTPPAEKCDGVDNNCDGLVDNLTQTCGKGACNRTAYCEKSCYVNSSGAEQCNWLTECNQGLPTAETCNNTDDDCNGVVDNAAGSLQANTYRESCNPNSCSQGGTRGCTNGVPSACTGCGGAKSCTTARCGEPSGIPCNSACELTQSSCPELAAEVCNDCDDTGNGISDEGLSCQPHAL